MKVFIGMETSGELRRRFTAKGHNVISCDVLPAEDGALGCRGDLVLRDGGHIQDDVFRALDWLKSVGWWPDLGIFHPTCTYHTVSAAWAFKDPDFAKYPGVGYHQRIKPGTLVGEARRQARLAAEREVERIAALPIERKAMENPGGTIPTRTSLGQPQQIVHPWQFGEDASKATCLWLWNLPALRLDRSKYVAPRHVNGLPRWANQTDSGQNRLSPGDDRWKDRSRTYPGIADAMVEVWG